MRNDETQKNTNNMLDMKLVSNKIKTELLLQGTSVDILEMREKLFVLCIL